MKLFGVLEINIKFLTKKQQIIDTLKNEGKIKAVKKCKELYGYDLTEALNFVRELEN